jgi:hypothetical protein
MAVFQFILIIKNKINLTKMKYLNIILLYFIFINCVNKNESRFLNSDNKIIMCPNLEFENQNVIQILNNYSLYVDSLIDEHGTYKKNKYNFYSLFIYPGLETKLIVHYRKPSLYFLNDRPPLGYFINNSNVFLIYSGMENVCKTDNYIIKILKEKFKESLVNDINPDGSLNYDCFYMGREYKSWLIIVYKDSIKTKITQDPWAPPLIQPSLRSSSKEN